MPHLYFVGIDVSNATGSNGSLGNAGFSSSTIDYYIVYENNSAHYGIPVSEGNAIEVWQASGSSSWSFISRTGGNDGVLSRIDF